MAETSGGNGSPDIEISWTFEAPRRRSSRVDRARTVRRLVRRATGKIPLDTVSMDVRAGGGGAS